MLYFERVLNLCKPSHSVEEPSSFTHSQEESKTSKAAIRFFRSLLEGFKSLLRCKPLERRVSVAPPAPKAAPSESNPAKASFAGPKTEAPKAYANPFPEGAYVLENDKPSLCERGYMDVKFLLLDSGRLVRPNQINLDAN